MQPLFIEVHRVENASDEIYRQALGRLYDLPEPTLPAILELLKWKEILDRVELAVDKCEDAANAIEQMVVKYG